MKEKNENIEEQKSESSNIDKEIVNQPFYYSSKYLYDLNSEYRKNKNPNLLPQLRKLILFSMIYQDIVNDPTFKLEEDNFPYNCTRYYMSSITAYNIIIEQLNQWGVNYNNAYTETVPSSKMRKFEIVKIPDNYICRSPHDRYDNRNMEKDLKFLLEYKEELGLSKTIITKINRELKKTELVKQIKKMHTDLDVLLIFKLLKELELNPDTVTLNEEPLLYYMLNVSLFPAYKGTTFPSAVKEFAFRLDLNVKTTRRGGGDTCLTHLLLYLFNSVHADKALDMMAELVHLGANSNIPDAQGKTPLYYLCESLTDNSMPGLRNCEAKDKKNNLLQTLLTDASYDNLINTKNSLIKAKEKMPQYYNKKYIDKMIQILGNYIQNFLDKHKKAVENTPILSETQQIILGYITGEETKTEGAKQIYNNLSTSSSSSSVSYYNRLAGLNHNKLRISYKKLPVDPSLSLDQDEEEKHLDPSSCCSSNRVTMPDNDNNKDGEDEKGRAQENSSSTGKKEKQV